MGVQTLDRTFDILELLAAHENGLSVGQISGELGLHKSTVSRLLHSLQNRGYVDKDSATGLFRVGLRFIELSSAHLDNLELRVEAKPAMYDLSQSTGQTAFLAIRQGAEAVYVDKTETYNSLRRYSIIGTTMPLYSSALGKALICHLDRAELVDLLGREALTPRTEHTCRDVDTLAEELHRTCERGYSLDNEENESGIRCIGAPIRDYRGHTIAAISISGYLQVVTEERVPELAERVRMASLNISRRMGYRGQRVIG
jgi:DNA-binding IclR family transcriptional regulator